LEPSENDAVLGPEEVARLVGVTWEEFLRRQSKATRSRYTDKKGVPASSLIGDLLTAWRGYTSGTASATSLTARAEEVELVRYLRSHPEFTKAMFKLKEVFDKHGADSKAWEWLCGNMTIFEGAPPGHGGSTEHVTAKKTSQRRAK
jgi:hypothetical protein